MPRPRTTDRVRQPRQERAVATVDAILVATTIVLREHGIEGLTTNAVARVAGVSVGTLYQYFADKQALCDAVVLRADAIFAERIGAVMPAVLAAPVQEAIELLLESIYSVRREDPALVRQVLRLWSRSHAGPVQHVLPSITEAVRTVFAARQQELCLDDVDRAVFVLSTAVHAVLVTRIIDDRFHVEDIERDINRLALGFFAAGRPQT